MVSKSTLVKNIKSLYKQKNILINYTLLFILLSISIGIYLSFISRQRFYINENKNNIEKSKEIENVLKDKEKALTNLQGQNRIIQHEIDLKEKYIIYANNKITYFQEAYDNIVNNATQKEKKLNAIRQSLDTTSKDFTSIKEKYNNTLSAKFKDDPSAKMLQHNIYTLSVAIDEDKKLLSEHSDIIYSILHSKIITSIVDINTLTSFFNCKRIQLNLIYSARENGASTVDFRKAVHGKDQTISLIKDKKGYIFGGYADIQMVSRVEEAYGFKADKNAFLFSLTNKKKYTIKPNEVDRAVYSGQTSLMAFGDGMDIFVSEDCFSPSANNYVSFPVSYGEEKTKRYEITDGNKHFDPEEVEVFQIKIIE